MKVLITGATGLVGSFICRELLSKGHTVKATKRSNSTFELIEDIKSDIEWINGEIGQAIFWDELLHDIDAVIHAAAIVSFDKRWEEQMYQTNVVGTADLVNALLKSKIKDFVLISSVAAIGRNAEHDSLNENDRWEGSTFDSIYARSKYLQELEAWRGAEEGLHVKIVNPSVVLGPGQWSNSGSTSVFKYVYDQKPFCPAGSANYVDVRDVASATVQLLESDIKSQRFILNAGSTGYKNFFGAIAEHFGKRGPTTTPNAWMLKIGVLLEWFRSRITGKQALITKETARISMNNFFFDNSKVKETLNFEFKSLEETLSWATQELKKANDL